MLSKIVPPDRVPGLDIVLASVDSWFLARGCQVTVLFVFHQPVQKVNPALLGLLLPKRELISCKRDTDHYNNVFNFHVCRTKGGRGLLALSRAVLLTESSALADVMTSREGVPVGCRLGPSEIPDWALRCE